MSKIHQVIVRNTPEKGLDIVASTMYKGRIHDISQFLPEKQSPDFDKIYLTKSCYPSGKIALRFTLDDGTDEYGRRLFKTHTLIVDQSFYNEMTIQYFISPFINETKRAEEDYLLTDKDFEIIPPFPVSSKLIEEVFSRKHLRITSQDVIDPLDLIQAFGTIDRAIPPSLNHSFSFQTNMTPNNIELMKKKSLVYCPNNASQSILFEKIQRESSEYSTIRLLTDSLSDLSTLRQIQRNLFLNIPEKRLNLKFRWRFGIKTVSNIRKAFVSRLNIDDTIKINHGSFKGKIGRIVSILQAEGKVLIDLEDETNIHSLVLSINSVEPIQIEEEKY